MTYSYASHQNVSPTKAGIEHHFCKRKDFFSWCMLLLDRGSRQWAQLMLMSHLLDTNFSSAWPLKEPTAATLPFGTMEVLKKKRVNINLRTSGVSFRILSGLFVRPFHLGRFYSKPLAMLWFHPKSQCWIHKIKWPVQSTRTHLYFYTFSKCNLQPRLTW